MRWLELFRPRLRLGSVFELDLQALRRAGIRALVLDLDNTLLPYGSRAVTDAVAGWVRGLQEAGFSAVLVSNSRGRRVAALAEALGVRVARGWAKPSGSMPRHAMALMQTRPDETAMVGDQVLTDILAGNRLGLYTVLVTPIDRREFPTTRILNRAVERIILRLLRLPPPAPPS